MYRAHFAFIEEITLGFVLWVVGLSYLKPIKRKFADMALNNTNGKRPIYTIDLTSDDDPPVALPSRKIHRSHPLDNNAESQIDAQVEHDIEDDADDIIILSQDGNDIASENYELYGTEPEFSKAEATRYNANL